jgi:DNA ligase-3
VYGTDAIAMRHHLERGGDISATAAEFFCPPQPDLNFVQATGQATSPPPLPLPSRGALRLLDVDDLLGELARASRDDERVTLLSRAMQSHRGVTGQDVKWLCRLVKKDLRTRAKDKVVLDALHPHAYDAFKATNDLHEVLRRSVLHGSLLSSSPTVVQSTRVGVGQATHGEDGGGLRTGIVLGQPIKPMLAKPCAELSSAFEQCAQGMYAEIKYDGERVQIHKDGGDFTYYSRSMKPVQAHKVRDVDRFFQRACPEVESAILDAEILLVDGDGTMLPFGSLGVHKQKGFSEATVCLFVFDLLFLNGSSLVQLPLEERRRRLESILTPIPQRIELSQLRHCHAAHDLDEMLERVYLERLEGLVLKDTTGVYTPNARRWLKVKRDYLQGGSAADSADLVVLGAYYGRGQHGGLRSVFLLGVYDEDERVWKTVCKCSNGLDEVELERLQDELQMAPIERDFERVPPWLQLHRATTPDFVVPEPEAAPVWEVIGASFSRSSVHTADGISIRFPRVHRLRTDRSATTATTLAELRALAAVK